MIDERKYLQQCTYMGQKYLSSQGRFNFTKACVTISFQFDFITMKWKNIK